MPDLVLATKFRPRRFEDVVGQSHIKAIIQQIVKTKKIPAAMVFAGSRGTGKTTTARIFGAALNCEDQENAPCGECGSCKAVAAGNSIDISEVDAASNGLVADIRKLKESVLVASSGNYRVVILDEAHSMSKEAFNALLKILEEPPPNTCFIMATTEPDKILKTVLSRSMLFEFRRMTDEHITKRLREIANAENLDVHEDLFLEIAHRVQGGMRDAIMLLDQISILGCRSIEDFRDLFGIRNVSVELLNAAISADYAAGSGIIEDYFFRVGDAGGMVNDLVLLIRDLLNIKSGGAPQVSSAIELEDRTRLAARVSIDKLVQVIKVLWDLKARTRHIDNDQRSAMEMAFVLIADTLSTASSAAPTSSGEPAKLTLAQMAQMS